MPQISTRNPGPATSATRRRRAASSSFCVGWGMLVPFAELAAHAPAPGQDVGERHVTAQPSRGAHQVDDVVPGPVHRPQPAVLHADVGVRQLHHARAGRLGGAPRVLRLAVQELRAQLGRQRPGAIVQREDPAAQARPRLDHDHAAPALRERAGRGQAGHASADHDHVGPSHALASPARRSRRIQRVSSGRP